MPISDHIRTKLASVPHRPGIYLMKDRFGTVIYVGKARDLRHRVSQYFHPSRRRGWDLKFNALVDAIHDFDVHLVRSEPEALLLEGRLIKEFHPRYNISFRDDKQFLLVKVNLNDPIPRFALTRVQQTDGSRYFGPFASSGAVHRTLALVRHRFNLRGCRTLTPAEADYRHCLYAHLRVCTAPCIGNVTPDQYRMQVAAACDFLDGQCEEMAGELEGQMQQAAAALNFEKAAQLRDLIADIRRTTAKTAKFERIPYTLPVAINPDAELRELAAALGLPAPPDRIEGFDISNISGSFKVASLVSFWRGRPDRANYRRYRIQGVQGQDDFACMAETIRRRYTRLLRDTRAGHATPIQAAAGSEPAGGQAIPAELQRLVQETATTVRARLRKRPASPAATPPDTLRTLPPGSRPRLPDLILIDGGKGQLHAACAELAKLGLATIPVIGLAKEFEEIHRPGAKEPLRLGLDHPAVKLLQRVRDESHRVANSYNAQLRLRKISESLLDEFPGIGDQRKAALLKRFGSVQRLRRATVDEIAAVPGFGGETAAKLKAFLARRTPDPVESSDS
ncbi:MAG TPA: excinuclease ABC subunit UvrC [Verrucomicrobiota bacterium]|nr:excinuclease ABC subunit UvrC [Verrucomicrobiota bacterium]HNU53225.1 excinuclease ABC subunit UvrC [Verrucomicrobiota bacterium]